MYYESMLLLNTKFRLYQVDLHLYLLVKLMYYSYLTVVSFSKIAKICKSLLCFSFLKGALFFKNIYRTVLYFVRYRLWNIYLREIKCSF